MTRSDAARTASDYFNSLSFEERCRLAPLLDDYRRMGLIEATNALKAVVRKMDERIRSIDEPRAGDDAALTDEARS